MRLTKRLATPRTRRGHGCGSGSVRAGTNTAIVQHRRQFSEPASLVPPEPCPAGVISHDSLLDMSPAIYFDHEFRTDDREIDGVSSKGVLTPDRVAQFTQGSKRLPGRALRRAGLPAKALSAVYWRLVRHRADEDRRVGRVRRDCCHAPSVPLPRAGEARRRYRLPNPTSSLKHKTPPAFRRGAYQGSGRSPVLGGRAIFAFDQFRLGSARGLAADFDLSGLFRFRQFAQELDP